MPNISKGEFLKQAFPNTDQENRLLKMFSIEKDNTPAGKAVCDHYFPATQYGYLPCEFCNEPHPTPTRNNNFKAMTIEEAKTALWDCQKITHERFLPHEFVFIENGVLWDEENNELDYDFFWSTRNNSMFETGWSIWNG